ncbi:hypothetical protein RchiOBHm_Chr1g0335071 [Rosa chinensis]|uniref:Uncharacterized protein n=1 Tax=Rosa chinensis TaxID=74649 RepID=A0A2P6SCG8_ROSCH|nr:hypothetical protein RchiOBHm_Chr1g0335071 [Rosa chinensis]
MERKSLSCNIERRQKKNVSFSSKTSSLYIERESRRSKKDDGGGSWCCLCRTSFSLSLPLRPITLLANRLCQECQTLIENHDKIKLLSNARNNLNTTLKDVEGMMSISVVASAARDSFE